MIEGSHASYQELPTDPIVRLEHIVTHAIPDSPATRFGTSVWYAYLAKSVDDAEIGELLFLFGGQHGVVPVAKRGGDRLRPARGAAAYAVAWSGTVGV